MDTSRDENNIKRSKAVVLLTTEIFVVKSETSLVIPFTTIFDALLWEAYYHYFCDMKVV